MASTALQRHVDYVEKQLDAIEDASREQLTDIPRILRESRVSVPRELYRRLREKVNARLAVLDGADPGVGDDSDGQWDIPTEGPGLDIQAVPAALKQIQHVMTNGDIASGALLIGVLCFFGSVICLAVATQPRAVWIVAAVITIGILVAAVWGSLAVLPSVLIHLGIKLPAFLDL
ncbi:hypothetical protein B0H19DRAFT_105218 [Mycena capillaripes]|nr:hypothetical protein B0H19DRAFT_105218 [Mycena capillaripes]